MALAVAGHRTLLSPATTVTLIGSLRQSRALAVTLNGAPGTRPLTSQRPCDPPHEWVLRSASLTGSTTALI